jgi:hypothetical protein
VLDPAVKEGEEVTVVPDVVSPPRHPTTTTIPALTPSSSIATRRATPTTAIRPPDPPPSERSVRVWRHGPATTIHGYRSMTDTATDGGRIAGISGGDARTAAARTCGPPPVP